MFNGAWKLCQWCKRWKNKQEDLPEPARYQLKKLRWMVKLDENVVFSLEKAAVASFGVQSRSK